jgi:mono/diheme cytochrome c family protein
MALVVLGAGWLGGCRQPGTEVKGDAGQKIYMTRCAVCHGLKEEGRPGLYPPLAGSEWVSGPPEWMAAQILDGLQGPVGKYNAVMPGWRGYLKDAEIAAVMTWLRQGAGKEPVSAVEVNRVHLETEGRNTFWTVYDLQNLRIH